MKNFILLLFAFIFLESGSAFSNTATVTVANFEIINAGTNFRFDIFVLRTSSDPFEMGRSTFVLEYTNGVISNPVISNQNPKYSTGNYNPMTATTFFNEQVALQINYSNGAGEVITSDPGITGFGERVATLTLDIQQAVQAQLVWETSATDIVTPSYFPIITSTYNGSYNGTLPVELTSFSASVMNNSVTLNWITSEERNNSGFEVERMTAAGSWAKIGFVAGAGNSSETKEYSFKDNNLNAGTYSYRLKQIDFNGNHEYFNLQNEVLIGTPSAFELAQNFPNPFNPSTKISFALPVDSRVTLEVYDMSGKLVQRLLNNEQKSANYYVVDFNASNLSSGMYFYSLKAGNFSETRKMLLVK